MIVEECVHAYSSGFTSTAKDGAYHTLGMDSEVVDSGGFHDVSTNNSRLTFSSGGIFLVFGAPAWANPGGTTYGRLTKNGTSVGYEYGVSGFNALPAATGGPFLFWLEDFYSGDYMESQGWNDNGGSGSAQTQMAALKVDEWSCMVGDTTTQTVGTFTSTVLTFANVEYDPHGMATATDRVEVQKAGYYLVLSIADGESKTEIKKNGSGSALKGSQGGSHDGQARGSIDYAVDWFEVGDYVRVTLYGSDRSLSVGSRQLAMIYLGGPFACLSYVYSDVDRSNAENGFITGILRMNTEWLDTGHGHPQHGFSYSPSPLYCSSCGSFNMSEGYHFGLAKLHATTGAFVNDGLYTVLNGSQLGNIFSTTRHVDDGGTMAFVCFEAVDGNTFTANWLASSTTTESGKTPFTNVFVTDAREGGGQIYRRL